MKGLRQHFIRADTTERAIMSKRSTRTQTAKETLSILKSGEYTAASGKHCQIAAALASARARSVLYTPTDFDAVFRQRDQQLQIRGSPGPCQFKVVNETTLCAAGRLLQDGGSQRVLALNFASARHPGGGFLNGSQAQEESLARASGLYTCLTQFPQMYEYNQHFRSCLYTDHMIYAPDVPVFRDDHDVLLEQPYLVSFLTAPAVNAGAVARNERANVAKIEPVMAARVEKILSVAVVHGYEDLILGAWGCGVFANDPAMVAKCFAHQLTSTGFFKSAFGRVVFAVLDRRDDRSTIRPFEQVFGAIGRDT
jgi:uncharacterized protein (TIGR02452 family)